MDNKIDAIELTPPLLAKSEEEYHEDMLNALPPDIDTSEGNLAYDHTRPVAMALAKFAGFDLQELRRAANPLTAVGSDLDLWAHTVTIERKKPTKASGTITIAGDAGITIPDGHKVYTIGDDAKESQAYVIVGDYTIGDEGTVEAKVEATIGGTTGNIPKGAISVIDTGIDGISSVTNNTPISNGTNEEDDDALRYRVLEALRERDGAGNKADYQKWAKSVDGVGAVIVQPLWDGGGTVKVLITDANGQVAGEELINRVKNYIDPTNGLGDGMAPVGANVTVGTLDILPLTISVTLEHTADDAEELKKDIAVAVSKYTASVDIIRVNEVGAIIIKCPDVIDYSNLLINGSVENITMSQGERAVVEEVVINDA